jgi:hypothetical protein
MTLRYEFDQDVDTVKAKLWDATYLADRLEAIGEDRPEVEVEASDDGAVMSLKRAARRDLPKVAAKIIGEVQRFEMTEKWSREGIGWRGEYHINILGAPVVIDARFDLLPADGGCVYSIDHHPKAKVPLVKKFLENFLTKQTRAGCIVELDHTKEALS